MLIHDYYHDDWLVRAYVGATACAFIALAWFMAHEYIQAQINTIGSFH